MPGERVSMRKIREVLRLRFAQGLSQRAIGISLGLSTGAVNSYLGRARMVGLGWPFADEFSDAELETLLYPAPPNVAAERRPVPNWSVVHRELRRPNMTLALLWEEYRGGIGGQDGFGYSWFCDLYREWAKRLNPTLRQVHTAGNGFSSTSPATPWRSSTARPEKYGALRSSSACSARRATPSRKRPGRNRYQTGLLCT